jgi:hypothetical protein
MAKNASKKRPRGKRAAAAARALAVPFRFGTPPPFTFDTPADGTSQNFPAGGLGLSGKATDASNLPTVMGYSLSGGQNTAITPVPTAASMNWSATLPSKQYLPVGTWHIITIYAYNGNGAKMLTHSVLRTG